MSIFCAECGHTNRGGARFCAGCGAALPGECPSCGATLSPDDRFCDSCGAAGPLESPISGATAEARKVLTVVFADLVGSTALQEQLDPESVRGVMTRFYEQMRLVIESQGGSLEKFIGDAVVAVFGRTSVREDDALRAVRAASAMVVALDSLNGELERVWGVRLRMRTGVGTGELVVSATGAVVGDPMNTAARLEQAAPADEVLVSEGTWRLVRHEVELEEVDPLTLKGKSQPVRAWRVASDRMPSRGSAAPETPLVGREDELARLLDALDGVIADGSCRLVTVVGSPGLGKSRLARELTAAARERAWVFHGRCQPIGEGVTLLPFAEILRAAAGIAEEDSTERLREKLTALVPERDPDGVRLVAAWAGLLNVAGPAPAQETFWSVRRGVELLARDRPLVLVLDDLHWGQQMLLDLVEHLVEWVRDAPVLVVALARPELRDAREALVSVGRRAVDVIELEPLDEGQSLQLLDALLGEVGIPPAVRTRILQVTEGNPLFLGETLRMLVDDGALKRDGESWVADEALAAVDVPPTIQALLAARIERLRDDERSVLERASVIGKQFYRGAVAELVAPPVAAGLDRHLEALRRKDMVEPEGTYWIDEPVYRFHHVLIRDAAYRSLLKETRSELHQRFAEWLEGKAGELVGEHEDVIAFHLEQAHEYLRELGPLDDRGRGLGRRAAKRLWSAGRRAMTREDLAAGADLLSRALACDVDGKAVLLWDLCDAVLSLGDTARAAGLVERFAEYAGDDDVLAARAQVLRGQLANLTGAPEVSTTAQGLAAAATVLVERGDGVGAARAHQILAGTYARLGRVGAVEEALDRALAAARSADDRRRTTAVLAAAPRAALWGPSPVVRASGRCLDVVRILRMTPGNRHVEAIALRCQAVLEAMRGRFEAAREIIAAGRTTLEELGLALELHETGVHAGIVELLADEPAVAIDALRTARAGLESLGAAAGAAQAAALLARGLVAVGTPEALAEAIAQTEFAELNSGEDLKTTIIWCSARAEALARVGELDEALRLGRRAEALADPTDALADKADAAIALARVLAAAGRGDEARSEARSAVEWYAAKGHTVGVQRAKQLADGEHPPERRGAVGAAAAEPGWSHTSGLLHERPPERFFNEFISRWDSGKLDAVRALFAVEPLHEHGDAGEVAYGRASAQHNALWDAIQTAHADVRFEIDEQLACDDRVIALRARWRGQAERRDQTTEILFGVVSTIRDGVCVRSELFDHDDRRGMIARYSELGGGLAALEDRPPEQWWRQLALLYASHQLEKLADLYTEDCAFIDHRRLGWPSGGGRRGVAKNVETVWKDSTDVRLDVDEVLACDARAIALRVTFRGTGATADGPGAWAYPTGAVAVVEDGCCVRVEYFGEGDREKMLLRFSQLSASVTDRGAYAPARHVEEWIRRWDQGDIEALLDMHAKDWVLRDHRTVRTMDEVRGRDKARGLFESLRALSADVRLEIDEVLACDERVIAYRHAWRGTATDGGGIFEAAAGFVTVIEKGLELSVDQYEADDRVAMSARYAELGGGLSPLRDRPQEHWFKRLALLVAMRDRERLLGLYAEDYAFTEHRRVGWKSTSSRHGVVERLGSIWSETTDIHLEVDEMLACDDSAIALRITWAGGASAAVGGGRFTFPLCVVVRLDGEKAKSWDQYEPEDTDAALARFAELGGRLEERPKRAPLRYYEEWIRRWESRSPELLSELYSPDWMLVEHRPLAATKEVLRGEHREALWRSILAAVPDARFEIEEVLACDEHVIALAAAWRGFARDGGGRVEVGLGVVSVIEASRQRLVEVFEPDDQVGMIACYVERGGGLRALGERPPERWFKRLASVTSARDRDLLLELYAEDYRFTDHRRVGWDPTSTRRGAADRIESTWTGTTDLHLEVDEVLACDERVIALKMTWEGGVAGDVGGGRFAYPLCVVMRLDGERAECYEQYEPEDRALAIARFAELGSTPFTSAEAASEAAPD